MKKRLVAILLVLSMMAAPMSMTAWADEAESDSAGGMIADGTGETDAEESGETGAEESGDADSDDAEETDESDGGGTGESGETDSEETDESDEADAEESDTEESDEAEAAETDAEEDSGIQVPALITEEHIAYISGQGSGILNPNGELTRAAAAQILYNLMTDTSMGPSEEVSFSDVSEEDWYYVPVTVLASWGVIDGFADGTFRPEESVTREQFVKMLSAFFETESGADLSVYSDYTENWAYDYMVNAVAKGWLTGYPDGTIRQENAVTRAEAITIINRALGRSASADETAELLADAGIRHFTDLYESDWYYLDVLEATVEHDFVAGESDAEEVWTSYVMPDCGYAAGWVTLGGYLYHVNEALQFDAYESGFQTIDGGIYYVNSSGLIPVYSAGMQAIGGYYYLILEDGSIDALTYTADSTVTLNGKVYYVDSTGKIPVLTTTGLQELNGELVYVQSDGSLLANASYNYLDFDENGYYTSGSDELDDLVDAALVKAGCDDDSLTQEEKLRLAYLYVRDNFTYLSRSHHSRGSTDWTIESATFMFTYGKGNCYCFAAAFLYMARRLGYDTAYAVSGGVGTANSDHAWVMITIDGTKYMFDVELEYAYRYRYSTRRYYNLYKQLRSNMPFVYYFPSGTY